MKGEEEPNIYGGIYVHIPFCHQACSYCDFYFSTLKKYIPKFLQALLTEIDLKKDFFCNHEPIFTLYFGGGTPSLLANRDLEIIVQKIYKNFANLRLQEVTIEANPEDVTQEKLRFWSDLGFNRISLGVQSLHENELKFMKRNHTFQQVYHALELLQNSNFQNFSVDVIYGLPNSSCKTLEFTLKELLTFKPSHFSCYALTIENKTLLNYQKQKQLFELDEEQYVQQYDFLVQYLENFGYKRYELSNFSLVGKISVHNSLYWKHFPYLGLGPSAHSFYPNVRSSNIANTHIYAEKLNNHEVPVHCKEELSKEQIALEKLMFQVRQNVGLNSQKIDKNLKEIWLKNCWIYEREKKIYFTNQGLMLSDYLILQLR
jgi:oxygen-independent coproporphyrinogen-3 oxidase